MATKTGGTNATTTLGTGLQYVPVAGATFANDVASVSQVILDDINVSNPAIPGAFSFNGQLFIPNRGVLKMLPGDWVFVDPRGWPILLSGNYIPTTLTATGNTHTSTLVDNLSSNVLLLGWKPGMTIVATTNADIPANTTIAAIAANGLSLTLSKAATGTNSGGTFTIGNWTHS